MSQLTYTVCRESGRGQALTLIVMGVNTDRSNEYSDFAGFTGLKFSYKGHEDVIFTLPYVT